MAECLSKFCAPGHSPGGDNPDVRLTVAPKFSRKLLHCNSKYLPTSVGRISQPVQMPQGVWVAGADVMTARSCP